MLLDAASEQRAALSVFYTVCFVLEQSDIEFLLEQSDIEFLLPGPLQE